MVTFKNLSKDVPYQIFKEKYDESLKANQINIEAICISSYSKISSEVNSRFVNLKFIDNNDFIFFTNYSSLKGRDFLSHNQISAVIYWNTTNIQIRLKAYIEKVNIDFNRQYFRKRDKHKNALAISSNQSNEISSYENVQEKYKKTLLKADLQKCPPYWGGYKFTPYYFEFWQGHENRINERNIYVFENNRWIHQVLEP